MSGISSETTSLKRTPLFEEHVALHGRMVPFGGWELPVQYEGILAEYEQTRKSAALFDVSHMGEFLIEGDLVESGLDRIVTQSLKDMPFKTSRYGCLLNEQGGTIDDLIVFRIDERKWFVVVNGATIEKDAQTFKKQLTSKASFKDVSFETGKVDLQGPQAREVLEKLVPDIKKLQYFTFDYFTLLGEKNVLISRTGYTGELGYEIFYPWDKIKNVWRELLKNPLVKPAGLGARDILRLECGYSLYGHELEENISPLEAGLSKFVDFNKEFTGKEALLKQQKDGLKKKLIGFESESRRSPRSGQKLFDMNNQEIGTVSSGSFSPVLNKGIGLGFVKIGHEKVGNKMNFLPGEKIHFGDEKNKNTAMITGRIFYKNGSLKN